MKLNGFFNLKNTESMKFLEYDLEEIICKTSNDKLFDRGLPLHGRKFRQQRIGKYGIADLITVSKFSGSPFQDPALVITVYEFKKDKVGISAFLQAVGYAKGIERYFSKRKKITKYNVIIRIRLVGRYIDTDSTFAYLADLIPSNYYGDFLSVYSYSYDIEGLTFKKEQNYSLIEEGI